VTAPTPRLHAAVLVGGEVRPARRLRDALADVDLVVAADGGLRHAAALRLTPDLLVGDFDSVDPETLARYPGLATERHPRDKCALDLELALDAAVERGATRITVVGGLSGRLDQTLATVLVTQARHAAGTDLTVLDGRRALWPVRVGETRELALTGGDLFSLLALDESASVSVVGARYPLAGARLLRASGLGVSNVALGVVRVEVHAGAVVAAAPGLGPRLPVR